MTKKTTNKLKQNKVISSTSNQRLDDEHLVDSNLTGNVDDSAKSLEIKPFTRARSLSLLLTGFFMGCADLIPGVSGGTIAFISGIYEELINSIKTGFSITLPLILRGKIVDALKTINWSLFIPLFSGILIAIISLSHLVEFVLTRYPAMTWSFFFGLVLASIVTVIQKVRRIGVDTVIGFIIGTALMYLIVGAVPVQTPATWWAFLFSGMLAICAMILPGISGSFILVILGKYQQVLTAVNNRDLLPLLFLAIGCVIGIGIFSQVLGYIFKHYHNMAISVLAGVMLGSLRKVWPWKETISTYLDSNGAEVPLVQHNVGPDSIQSLVFAVILAFLGFIFVVGFELIQKNSSSQDSHV